MEKTQKTQSEVEKTTEGLAATANPETDQSPPEETKVVDPMPGMTEEEKKKSMKESLNTLISQLEPKIQTTGERRNIDKLKHLLPLYESHSFWDTQPVPKNINVTDVSFTHKRALYRKLSKKESLRRSRYKRLPKSPFPSLLVTNGPLLI